MSEPQKGWRGSEELWLNAAYEILVSQGVDAVKILPLARAVGMSRPSFYWHFEDREALLKALIARWEAKNTGNLVAQTQKPAATIEAALFHLFDCWLDTELFDAHLDFAIRNWAQGTEALKAALEQADRIRIDALAKMFERHGFKQGSAFARGSTVYYTQVGYISMMMDEPKQLRIDRMPAYVETFTGKHPSLEEISAFRARHLTPAEV